jgi:hypothetical protein
MSICQKNCPKCGKEIPQGGIFFCPECGADLETEGLKQEIVEMIDNALK